MPPRGPANIMPGGTAHTAGGEKFGNEPSYVEVVKSLGPQYYLNFHKRPCVRDSQLTGIAAGFVGGSLGAIIRSKEHSRVAFFYVKELITPQNRRGYVATMRS